MTRPVLASLLIAGLLAPATAAAGIADDYYAVLNFLINNRGFNCATAATIAGDFLGYDCTLTPVQVTLSGNQCIAALQNSCVLAPSTLGVDDLAAGDLVITEIMQNPLAVGDADGEYFEVYNGSGADVDLDGLVVSDLGSDSFEVSGSLIVAAGDYAVFGKSTDTAINGGVPVDYAFGTSMTLANGDDEVVLSNTLGVTIDSVAYDGGLVFPDPIGAAMSLDPSALDAVSNDDGGSWCEASSSYGDGDLGTPGAANDDCAPAM